MAIYSNLIEGLTNGEELYVKVFTVNNKKRVNNRADLPFAIAIPSDFPSEPSEYTLIDKYTTSQTFTVEETGYIMVEAFGASGNGGNAKADVWEVEDVGDAGNAYGGNGGGSGGYVKSAFKVSAGDTIEIVCGGVGSDTTVLVRSSAVATPYTVIVITSGTNGGRRTGSNASSGAGVIGTGGIATDNNIGNIECLNGNNGSMGEHDYDGETAYVWMTADGGAGGAAVIAEGNPGGRGGSVTKGAKAGAGESGKAGFIKLYRGNTNKASA